MNAANLYNKTTYFFLSQKHTHYRRSYRFCLVSMSSERNRLGGEEVGDDDHGRSSDYPTIIPPHFIKIMSQSTLPHHKMLIPEEFVTEFGSELSTFAILIVPYGRIWRVELEKQDKKIWFSGGWKEFVEYYSIGFDGHLLTFIHDGDSRFYVLICNNTSGYQIKYPFGGLGYEADDNVKIMPNIIDENQTNDDGFQDLDIKPVISCYSPISRVSLRNMAAKSSMRSRTTASGCSLVTRNTYNTRSRNIMQEGHEELAELGNVNVPQGAKLKKAEKSHVLSSPAKHREDVKLVTNRKFSFCRQMLSEETKKAIRAAEMCKFENPSFLVALLSHTMVSAYLDFPAEFVTKHMNQCFEYIHLQDQNGKQKWPVRCVYRQNSTSVKQIRRGWSAFAAENNLQVGDVCVFELIENGKNPVLKVWIYHATDYTGSAKKRRVFQQNMGMHSSRRSTASNKGRLGTRDTYTTRNRNIRKEKQEDLAEPGNNVNIPRGVQWKKVRKSHPLSSPAKHKDNAELVLSQKFFGLRHMLSVETKKAIRAAKMYKLENPSFLVVLRPYTMEYGHLNVPAEFVTKHLNWCSEYIHLQNQNGKQWDARCWFPTNSSFGKQIGRGWSGFSDDNDLEEGDVCVFELIKKGKNPVLKVWIYRAAEYVGSAKKRRKVK